ncbi:MAG TPA: urate hydroxylase PuuD [Stellaceae bacterium]|nr:urate hydroxylase PuuD [Stellaceae bacterium]
MEFVSTAWWVLCFRWLHILSGIMWIGHLYYFNFTQTPTMPKIPAELRPAIPRFIMPEALWWFRWGAMSTIVFGLLLAYMNGYLGSAILIGIGSHSRQIATIGIGMWLGTIMWFNVWFIIWPNQQKVLGMVEATDDQKKKAARVAGLASRTNTLLSIPMVYCMTAFHFA